jgi:hypothetical protein
MITKDYHQIIKEKEMKLKLGVLTLACSFGLLFMASQSQAYQVTDYTLNFSDAAAANGASGISDVLNVDRMVFDGQSVVAFHDLDGSKSISAGDTFDDFFAIRFTSFQALNGDPLQSNSYGAIPGDTHELTVLGWGSGHQTTDNDYVFDSLNQLDFQFDAGNSFTTSTFSNLSTFADGVTVEDAGLVLGGGHNEDQTGITGTLSLVLNLNDILHTIADANNIPYGYFETFANGDPLPATLTLGVVDSDNTGQDVNIGAFQKQFTTLANTSYDFIDTGSNHGSMIKTVVPEPATMTLFGLGLFGLAGIGGRKKFFKPSAKA